MCSFFRSPGLPGVGVTTSSSGAVNSGTDRIETLRWSLILQFSETPPEDSTASSSNLNQRFSSNHLRVQCGSYNHPSRVGFVLLVTSQTIYW